ncbi:hypothetical protein C8R46DRAFT_234194 [Mycena filopes]|nr:hypothetical protein C8R46DRAFT_234194 [Mycena filopes]
MYRPSKPSLNTSHENNGRKILLDISRRSWTRPSTRMKGKEIRVFSPAYQAKQRLLGIYPHLKTVPEKSWKLDELLNDPVVSEKLGQQQLFVAKEDVNFQKELEQFLASALAGSETRAFWPLVKIVKIMGRFDVLSTGITLVDLPGHGDADNSRDGMANEYLKTADAICLVAGITRAKDDRDIHHHLHKHLSQTIIDGRIQEKSILIALTSTDSPIGGNEITLQHGKQEIVDALLQDALRITQDLAVLREKKEKKEKSKAKKKVPAALEKIKEQMSELSRQKTIKTKEINRLRAIGRSEIVSELLQDKYRELFRNLSRLSPDAHVPPIPIFCVGSRDFMRILQVEDVDDPIIFNEPEETGIPQLRSYFESHGERRNLTEAIGIVSSVCEFLSRTSSTKFSASPMGDLARAALVQEVIAELEQRCGNKLNEMVAEIQKVHDALLLVVNKAVSDAEANSPKIFESHTAKKWNQYRAMMRQEGQYETGNLNADLTKNILPSVGRDWNISVNSLTPLKIKDFSEAVEEDIIATIKSISLDPSVRKSLGIETFVKGLHDQNLTATKTAQRQGSRTWEPLMKKLLKPQYARVSAERGTGMYKRMKALNREYILNHSSELYGDMSRDIQNLFSESVNNIVSHDRRAFKRYCTTIRQTILGVKISPEFTALGQAQKSIKGFVEEHEEPTMSLLDDLKTRLQQIPLS